ncbi:(d)CMP kinase [Candidatus Bipolaricaulota bacterium]|nr:(d)CMP kinase [Candidatus Bipolaricaulota bacterium]
MKIAIDGPAASGKSTLGMALAKLFDLRFVETGKMYRAVALAFDLGIDLPDIEIEVTRDERFLLNGQDVTSQLHTSDLDQKSSQVATRADVRSRLVELQRHIAEKHDVVMEGRDIGTVVLPSADVKIFLKANARERALRRMKQRGSGNLEEIERELLVRDRRDSERAVAPLKPATDATIIETDRKSLKEVISEASILVRDRLGHVAGAVEDRD